jgi:hypothetical protein
MERNGIQARWTQRNSRQFSFYGARLCAKHQPQRVDTKNGWSRAVVLQLVLQTQPRSKSERECWEVLLRLSSTFQDLQAQNLTRFAFRDDLEWAAAYFAVRRKSLRGDAGIDDQFKGLAAKRTCDGFSRFQNEIREY